MVKQVIQSTVDEIFLQKLITSGRCAAGVLVGHCAGADKDYIAAYIECPNKDSDESSSCIADIDDAWFAAYCSQIALNLPGGISIIGIFLCAKPSDAKEVANKLKILASRTYKLLSKLLKECWSFSIDQWSTTWTLVHFSQANAQTVSVKQYDVTAHQDVGQSVELKRLNHNVAWSNLQASVNVNQDHALHSTSLEMSSFHQLCSRISRAHVILDHESRLETQILDPATCQSGKASKNKKNLKQEAAKIFDCQLYLPETDIFDRNMSTKHIDGSVKAKVQGSILAEAFVPPGSTVKTATDAIKSDIIRSIQQRCLIINDSRDEMDDQKITSFCQLPMRVLARGDKNPAGIYFSDYVILDEPVSECIDRFRDLFGIKVKENELIQECFKESEKPIVENLSAHDNNDAKEQLTGSVDSKAMIMLIAVLGVVIGICLLLFKS